MPGTGIHGYTGTSSTGKYNLVNGQITGTNSAYDTPAFTSGGYPIVNRNGAVMTSNSNSGTSSSIANSSKILGSGLADKMLDEDYGYSSSLASAISDIVSRSNSDYADMVREVLANQDANTAKSQAFAREQMEYQTRSDQAAMAWSAAEAQKNRDWQERLSDTAHQREVKDLLAAGLNPVLSANAGAYTGSGATGQGFSSSGAMGNVDTSGTGVLGSLYSTVMNTASQAMIAGLYTEAERYSADQQFAAAKLGAEASIWNNNNSVTAQKAIAEMNNESEIQRANINAAASRYSADQSRAGSNAIAGASMYAAEQSRAASQYASDNALAAQKYNADSSSETQKWLSQHNVNTNPAGYVYETGKTLFELGKDLIGSPSESNVSGKKWNSSMLRDF